MIEMNEAEDLSQEIQTAQIARVARRSAKILKITALVLAVGSLIYSWINATTDQNEFYGGPPTDFPFKWKLQQFLSSAVGNLSNAALVLAAGFAIEIVALRVSRVPEAAELPVYKPAATPEPPAGPVNFAARPAPSPTTPIPVTPTAPPPMKIANDEIWRR